MGRPKKEYNINKLTKKQEEIYEYIKDHVQKRNYPPSVRDICAKVGLKSTSSVFTYLNDLEKLGLIRKDPAHPRAIEILNREGLSLEHKAVRAEESQEEAQKEHKDGFTDTHTDTERTEDTIQEELTSLPIIGTVAAGTPIFAEENITAEPGELYPESKRGFHD